MSDVANIQARYTLRRPGFSFDVDLDLPLRGISGVFGPSGAGKTTLLRCIAGLEQAEGKLLVDGTAWQDSTAGIRRKVEDRDIGFVFQEPRLFDHLDVAGNIDYGRKRCNGRVDAAGVVEMLGLEHLLRRRPHELSGGEAQRVAIARALCRAPRFVLMDEPLASLDQARRDEILPYLERLHSDAGVPIVYVSHNIEEICRLCDHLVVIENGGVVAVGSLQSVLVGLAAPLLGDAQAGSVVEGMLAECDAGDGLTRLEFSGGSLWVPGEAGEPGAVLRLRILASDVSLCRVEPEQTTILNVLPATVESIEENSGPSLLVRLRLGSDRILARVTRRSVRELDIKPGDQLFAQIKSVAVRRSLVSA